jgi:hypothetical protein
METKYTLITFNPGYRIGTDGSVWSRLKRKGQGRGLPFKFVYGEWSILKPSNSHNGYLCIKISGTRYLIHRLVMQHFIGDCPIDEEVRHKNGVRTDNRLINLLYGTKKQNMEDSKAHGTWPSGENNGRATITRKDVEDIRLLAKTRKYTEIAKLYKMTPTNVGRIVRKELWKD